MFHTLDDYKDKKRDEKAEKDKKKITDSYTGGKSSGIAVENPQDDWLDKMKKYDLFTIIKPNLDNDEADKVVSRVEEIIKSLGGSVSDCDKMGRKKLAYDVAGFSDGFMVNQVVTVPADKITELKRQIKLNDSIIRTMFTTKEAK